MSKSIAILSSDFARTIEWAVNILGVNRVDISGKRLVVKDKDGAHITTYIVIQDTTEGLAWEFSDYLKAPDYFTLEDTIKTRVR